MTSKRFFFSLFLFVIISPVKSQSIAVLKQEITTILADKKATVGIAITGTNPKDTLSIHGDVHLPMQSVFKYHLAVAVLDQVDKGKLQLDDTITVTKDDLTTNLWSPIRKKFPNGVDLSLAEIIRYTVAYSDNIGCDILFELIGGSKVLESYLHKAGITDIAIVYNEALQQSVWERQYENWTTAKAANKALKIFYENCEQQLSPQSHDFLWEIMRSSNTGKKAIRGNLPKDVIVAHKTGHSGKNKKGLTGAQNDIGIIFLPNGDYFYLSVLVSNSMEGNNVNSKIIADITKLTWDFFKNK